MSPARANKRLERTRHQRASLLSNLGEPLKRNVGRYSLAKKKMRTVCRLITLGCLLFLSANSCFAIGRVAADVLPFDRYGSMSYEEEEKRLAAFAAQLKKQPQMIGYIYVQEGRTSCGG